MKRSAFVEAIINRIPVLDFTMEVARIHAQLFSYLSTRGEMIGAHDLMIGATAIAYGYTLLTNNPKEFKKIPGLAIV